MLQVRACVPHLPQLSRSAAAGAQSFWSKHAEKGVHFHPPSVAWQVRDCAPHKPHGCFSTWLSMHTEWRHAPSIHVQLDVQVAAWVPSPSHGRCSVVPAAHASGACWQNGGSQMPSALHVCR
jgi:hypothetical protein